MLKGDHSFQRRQETTLASPIKSSQHPRWWRRNWFYVTLITLAIVGVFCAFFLPPLIPGIKSEGETTDSLRKAILAVLAGSLTMLTLSETHRKNNQEKEKNENDHTRQVYAERRSRYTKAVEQLASEKAAVRLGGIYTLVGLVDDWRADDTLGPEARQKEEQVIINNLCSYIRSPFTLALKAEILESDSEPDNYEGDFSKDQAAFHEEQDVRRTIFVEMSKRSSTFTMNEQDEIIETIPGMWSDFDFDFSRAPVFYPLNAITIEKGNFSSTKFYSNADFSEATFTQTADFSEATFTQIADFSEATFTQDVVFSWAKFARHAVFSGATFTKYVYFFQARFTQYVVFSSARFTQDADFSEATFTQTADFNKATFTQTADFNRATFTQNADFSEATFTQIADFSEATFSASSPKFMETSKVKFMETSEVKYVVIPKVLGMTFRARFATLPEYQTSYDFTVSEGSFPILLGEAELGDGAKYHIPVGTVLFDPDFWDEEKQEYTRVSNPAEPLTDSDSGKENITE